MDALDLQLLNMIAEAEETGKPASTWQLASKHAKTSLERNKLDGIYRYRLQQLHTKRLIRKHTILRGKQKITIYTLNPKKFICNDSAVIILSNPITILACRFQNNCKIQMNRRFPFTKCRLYAESPPNIQKLIRDNLAKKGHIEEVT